MFGLGLAASAWFPAIWCVDTNSHLLRQNTNRRNDPDATQLPQLSPSFGSATMEAAGEATVTWAPAEEVDQSLVRAARRKKGAQHRQTPAPSSATLSAMSTHKRRSSVPEGLVQGERRCAREEFDGEQGPEPSHGTVWSNALEHEEDDSNVWPSHCTHTSGQNATHPGYWFVKFADGQTHNVSKVRLWNRDGCCPERLNGACVRFTMDGTKPSTASPHVEGESCDMNLPHIPGTGPGTEVVVRMAEVPFGNWQPDGALVQRVERFRDGIAGGGYRDEQIAILQEILTRGTENDASELDVEQVGRGMLLLSKVELLFATCCSKRDGTLSKAGFLFLLHAAAVAPAGATAGSITDPELATGGERLDFAGFVHWISSALTSVRAHASGEGSSGEGSSGEGSAFLPTSLDADAKHPWTLFEPGEKIGWGPLESSAEDAFLAHTLSDVVLRSRFVLAASAVEAWGDNSCGQLGLQTGPSRAYLYRPSPSLVFQGLPVSKIASSSSHTLFLTESGVLFSCGTDISGCLGLPVPTGYTNPSSPIPQRVHGGSGDTHFRVRVVDVAVGARHSVAVAGDGRVFTWGCADFAQLGHGENYFAYERVPDTRHGGSFPCLRFPTAVGSLWGAGLVGERQELLWGGAGAGAAGGAGSGVLGDAALPPNTTGVKGIACFCGNYTTYVLAKVEVAASAAEDGGGQDQPAERLFAWGNHSEGQCGVGSVASEKTVFADKNLHRTALRVVWEPSVVELEVPNRNRIANLAVGPNHCVAIDALGRAFSWGQGLAGKLGHGDQRSLKTPLRIPGLSGCLFASLGAGFSVVVSRGVEVHVGDAVGGVSLPPVASGLPLRSLDPLPPGARKDASCIQAKLLQLELPQASRKLEISSRASKEVPNSIVFFERPLPRGEWLSLSCRSHTVADVRVYSLIQGSSSSAAHAAAGEKNNAPRSLGGDNNKRQTGDKRGATSAQHVSKLRGNSVLVVADSATGIADKIATTVSACLASESDPKLGNDVETEKPASPSGKPSSDAGGSGSSPSAKDKDAKKGAHTAPGAKPPAQNVICVCRSNCWVSSNSSLFSGFAAADGHHPAATSTSQQQQAALQKLRKKVTDFVEQKISANSTVVKAAATNNFSVGAVVLQLPKAVTVSASDLQQLWAQSTATPAGQQQEQELSDRFPALYFVDHHEFQAHSLAAAQQLQPDSVKDSAANISAPPQHPLRADIFDVRSDQILEAHLAALSQLKAKAIVIMQRKLFNHGRWESAETVLSSGIPDDAQVPVVLLSHADALAVGSTTLGPQMKVRLELNPTAVHPRTTSSSVPDRSSYCALSGVVHVFGQVGNLMSGPETDSRRRRVEERRLHGGLGLGAGEQEHTFSARRTSLEGYGYLF
eukprot:g7983.t1